MKLAEFDYDLPASSIAQEPANPRDHSRLLVLNRESKAIEHRKFYDIPDFLRPGDLIVLNHTRVFPARLRGKKKSGGKVEVLLLDRIMSSSPNATVGDPSRQSIMDSPPTPAGNDEYKLMAWRALVRGAVKPIGLVFPEGLEARMSERLAEGEWVLEFSSNHLREYLDRHGEMPLPPYIKRAAAKGSDVERYQTVYAKTEGSVAAPTAGFHFTSELLEKLRAKGVSVQFVTLHVGWGTFRPVRTETIEEHKMLPETYELSESTAGELNAARLEGRRIIAVGTTAVRTLETLCDDHGRFTSGSGQTNLFIYPGYRFKAVDALITNFHLPDSTPLLLACAFYGSQKNDPFSLRFAYDEAIREGYRFYSYGDAMFIQ